MASQMIGTADRKVQIQVHRNYTAALKEQSQEETLKEDVYSESVIDIVTCYRHQDL